MGEPAKVLVVDDNAPIVEVIDDVLRDAGYDVVQACGGQHALELLRAGATPAVILLDLTMPAMDGAAFLGELAKVPRLASIPVVAMSAVRNIGAAVAGLRVKATLEKPFKLEELLDVVREAALPRP